MVDQRVDLKSTQIIYKEMTIRLTSIHFVVGRIMSSPLPIAKISTLQPESMNMLPYMTKGVLQM